MLDVVDMQDHVVGMASRHNVHDRRLCHRAVHLLLFNPQGELFVQKRSASKDTFPLRYDSSASGHVDSGETYDVAVVRELQEELGLNVPFRLFGKHFRIPACAETGWEFVWVYREPPVTVCRL
jgi:16S rRNA (adenine1518-N6/adenine1519-N6)-dimethyltransferase